jgi:hypothetical protein
MDKEDENVLEYWVKSAVDAWIICSEVAERCPFPLGEQDRQGCGVTVSQPN